MKKNKIKPYKEWLKKDALKYKIKNKLIKLLKERKINIKKIIIFGSFITERFNKNSDIDIIIVSENFKNKNLFERVKLMTGVGRELVKMLKLPVDLMYYSEEEWEKENFINKNKKKGQVILNT